ncbi:MAG: aspartate dehydrogenase [Sedimentitalea sp.]
MSKIAVIGYGAVARYLAQAAADVGIDIAGVITRPGRGDSARAVFGSVPVFDTVAALPMDVELVVDCAGHPGLRAHGAAALQTGRDVITVATGALADDALMRDLTAAALAGHSRLRLASGAIGALDALSAAAVGRLHSVNYTGRKPPAGWAGSPAEAQLDLANLTEPAVHFDGSARACALAYPKNANVAASVALAGLGLDLTQAQLIADPGVTSNIHEVTAVGDFGEFRFTIAGKGLPDNPKSSALTAMSVVASVLRREAPVVLA